MVHSLSGGLPLKLPPTQECGVNANGRWRDRSRVLLTARTGDATGAVGCTIVDSPAQRGPAAAAALAQEVIADWGQVRTVDRAGTPGLTLAVSAPRTGWQYAHWL